jgi:hypothetical protein
MIPRERGIIRRARPGTDRAAGGGVGKADEAVLKIKAAQSTTNEAKRAAIRKFSGTSD